MADKNKSKKLGKTPASDKISDKTASKKTHHVTTTNRQVKSKSKDMKDKSKSAVNILKTESVRKYFPVIKPDLPSVRASTSAQLTQPSQPVYTLPSIVTAQLPRFTVQHSTQSQSSDVNTSLVTDSNPAEKSPQH